MATNLNKYVNLTADTITANISFIGGNVLAGSNLISTTGNVDAGNLNVTSKVTFGSTNITGNALGVSVSGSTGFIFADAGLLSNVSTNKISNVNSNINIPTASGPIIVKVGSSANTVTFTDLTSGSAGNVLLAQGNISLTQAGSNYYFGNGKYLTGITANSSFSTSNGNSGLSAGTANGNLSVSIGGSSNTVIFSNTVTGSGNVLIANGNISANYYYGNGAFLTGVSANLISNINTSVNIPIANGNAYVGIGGSSNTVTFANLITGSGNVLLAQGNVSLTTPGSNYYFGNGYYLTGIVANTSFSTSNGGSNLNVITANGNVTVGVGGSSNTVIFANLITGSGNVLIANGNIKANFYYGDAGYLSNVTANLISNVFSNINIPVSSGPIIVKVNSQANTVTFGDGTSGSNVLLAQGNVSLTQTGKNFYFGNGAFLTGITANTSFSTSNGGSSLNAGTANGNITVGIGGSSNNVIFANLITGSGNVLIASGNISLTQPGANFYFGDGGLLSNIATNRIANGTSNVNIPTINGPIVVKVNSLANVVTFGDGTGGSNVVLAQGNISLTTPGANYYFGNGAYLTGVSTSSNVIFNGNSNVKVYTSGGNVTVDVAGVANVFEIGSSNTSIKSNVIIGNATTGGNIVVYGNIVGNVGAANVNGSPIGYLNIPQVGFANGQSLSLSDTGRHIYVPLTSNVTIFIPNNGTANFIPGSAVTLITSTGTGNLLISRQTGVNMYLAGNSASSNRALQSTGMATLVCVAANTWYINGANLTYSP
jgi:hypothetical protein